MNVLLDEFLYKILSTASSLSTDKLKAGLNKILPTALGKDAVLEAELELKAYWERNTPHKPSNQDFDLQWSFEVSLHPEVTHPYHNLPQLLRLKCEAYSTMNDNDEDVEVERKLNEKMQSTGASGPPHASLMAPAALYMTAILECVLLEPSLFGCTHSQSQTFLPVRFTPQLWRTAALMTLTLPGIFCPTSVELLHAIAAARLLQ